MTHTLSTCPFCGCGCGLYLLSDDGVPSGVAPSEHHAVSGGTLCARGWAAHEAPVWGERLTQPLVRRGGSLVETSWADALDFVATRLRELRAAGHALGVLGSPRLTNEEAYVLARLARGALRTPHVDVFLGSSYQPLLAGLAAVSGDHHPFGTFADVAASGAILLIEDDIATTHPKIASVVLGAVKRGGRLVTIGSSRTQMTRHATIQLAARPGEEAEILVALLGRLGERAMPRHEADDEVARGTPSGAEGTRDLDRAAALFAAAERASILLAPRSGSAPRLRREATAAARLAAATGHLARAGSAWLPLAARTNLRGCSEMGLSPELLTGLRRLDDAGARSGLAQAWKCDPATGRGADADQIAAEMPGVLIVGDDVAAALRAPKSALACLAAAECVVVIDSYPSAAATHAHAVLPIACHAEAAGTVTNIEGRVQRVRPCSSPRGLARPGWWVLAELTRRLGLADRFTGPDDVLEEIRSVVPGFPAADSAPEPDRAAEPAAAIQAEAVGEAASGAPPPRSTDDTVMALDGVFDWAADPLVASSPTLAREPRSERKLFPRGAVTMTAAAADALGVRQSWPVKVISERGEVTLPVVIRPDLGPGMVVVSYAHREHVIAVIGDDATPVRVERA